MVVGLKNVWEVLEFENDTKYGRLEAENYSKRDSRKLEDEW